MPEQGLTSTVPINLEALRKQHAIEIKSLQGSHERELASEHLKADRRLVSETAKWSKKMKENADEINELKMDKNKLEQEVDRLERDKIEAERGLEVQIKYSKAMESRIVELKKEVAVNKTEVENVKTGMQGLIKKDYDAINKSLNEMITQLQKEKEALISSGAVKDAANREELRGKDMELQSITTDLERTRGDLEKEVKRYEQEWAAFRETTRHIFGFKNLKDDELKIKMTELTALKENYDREVTAEVQKRTDWHQVELESLRKMHGERFAIQEAVYKSLKEEHAENMASLRRIESKLGQEVTNFQGEIRNTREMFTEAMRQDNKKLKSELSTLGATHRHAVDTLKKKHEDEESRLERKLLDGSKTLDYQKTQFEEHLGKQSSDYNKLKAAHDDMKTNYAVERGKWESEKGALVGKCATLKEGRERDAVALKSIRKEKAELESHLQQICDTLLTIQDEIQKNHTATEKEQGEHRVILVNNLQNIRKRLIEADGQRTEIMKKTEGVTLECSTRIHQIFTTILEGYEKPTEAERNQVFLNGFGDFCLHSYRNRSRDKETPSKVNDSSVDASEEYRSSSSVILNGEDSVGLGTSEVDALLQDDSGQLLTRGESGATQDGEPDMTSSPPDIATLRQRQERGAPFGARGHRDSTDRGYSSSVDSGVYVREEHDGSVGDPSPAMYRLLTRPAKSANASKREIQLKEKECKKIKRSM